MKSILIEAGRNYGWPNVAGYRRQIVRVRQLVGVEPAAPAPHSSGGDAIPASVPTQAESAWNNPQFAPPLRTFFTVETGYDLRTIGSGTIAPGGVDLHTR